MRHSKTRELLVVSFPGDALFFSFCALDACQRAFRKHVRQLSGTFFRQQKDSLQDISDGRPGAARHTHRPGLVRRLTLELSRIVESVDSTYRQERGCKNNSLDRTSASVSINKHSDQYSMTSEINNMVCK